MCFVLLNGFINYFHAQGLNTSNQNFGKSKRAVVIALEPISSGGLFTIVGNIRFGDKHHGLGVFAGLGYNNQKGMGIPSLNLKNPIQFSYLFGKHQDQLDVRLGVTNNISFMKYRVEGYSRVQYGFLSPSAYIGYRYNNLRNNLVFTLGLSFEKGESFIYPNFGLGYRIQ